MVSCQKGPTRHAYAWQIGPFWQDTLDISFHFCGIIVTTLLCDVSQRDAEYISYYSKHPYSRSLFSFGDNLRIDNDTMTNEVPFES